MNRGRKLAGVVTLIAASAIGLSACKPPVSPPGAAQGWSEEERDSWYNARQGSRLLPLAWFDALERPQAAGAGAFRDPGYLAAFGILPPWGKQTLPIGFAINEVADDTGLRRTNLHWTGADPKTETVTWVGLNCAACHTARITYKGEPHTVDGAPGMFDFQSFIEALDASLVETQASAAPGADPARWDRFAKAVLAKTGDTPETRASLLRELGRLVDWEQVTAKANDDADARYGFGRVDAVGHIYNRVLLFTEPKRPVFNRADAPVSYPHLWNITLQSRLQWNGIAQTTKLKAGEIRTDFGALGRNTGEVLGVFGEVVIVPPKTAGSLTGFVSTADVDNLNRMEVLLTRLKPMAWPATFGTPGAVEVADDKGAKLAPAEVLKAGGALFQAKCASCHTPNDKSYETMVTFAQMGPENQTDEYMACNAWAYTGPSGKLTGVPANYRDGMPLAANAQVAALLTTTVKGALIGKKLDIIKVASENFFGVTPLPRGGPQASLAPGQTAKDLQLAKCQQNAAIPLMAYKARPLEGIWATAPFLHNGSAPTLYDLLLPVEKRPQTFRTGTREYDPTKGGYDITATAVGNSFTFDTRLGGNSNKGHVYGVGGLTEAQRLQLLEYLKTL